MFSNELVNSILPLHLLLGALDGLLRAEKRQVAVNKAGRFSCFYFGENFDTKNTTEKPT
jgi:hypothetical protein